MRNNEIKSGRIVRMAIVAFLLSSTYLSAQTAKDLSTIRGKVQSASFPYNELYPVSVRIISHDKDTLHTHTDKSGLFHLQDIPSGKIEIKLQLAGFESRSDTLSITSGTNILLFRLQEKTDTLNASRIKAERQIVRQVKDTTYIDAKHVNSMEGDSAAQMLEQVPGVRITNQGVYYNGSKVKRTYVNGTLVYGDNTKAALNSLYASQVTEVQIYDELSPEDRHRGLTRGWKETVMNIVTSEKILKASDFTATLAGGTKNRYSIYEKAQFFSEKLIVDEKIVSDNTDPSQVDVTSIDPTVRSVIQQDNKYSSFNTQAARYWKDRLYGNSFKAMVGYGQMSSSSSNSSRRLYSDLSSEAFDYQDSTSSSSNKRSLYVDLNLDMKDTRTKSWFFSNKLTLNDAVSESSTLTKRFSENRLLNMSAELNGLDSRSWNNVTLVQWANNDNTSFRPSFSLSVNSGRDGGVGVVNDTLHTAITQRLLNQNENLDHLNVDGRMMFEKILSSDDKHSSSLSVGYHVSFDQNSSSRYSRDVLRNGDLDPLNTYDYTNSNLSNSIETYYSLLRDKISVNAGLVGRLQRTDNHDCYPVSRPKENHSFFSVCPSLSMRIGKNVSINLSTSANAPSTDMLRDWTDGSNSYFYVEGNPNLKQEYTTSLSTSYHKAMNSKNASFSFQASGNLGYNSLMSNTYMRDGVIVTRYENTPFKQSVEATLSYSKFIPSKKLSLYLRNQTRAGSTPQYSNNELVYLNGIVNNSTVGVKWQYKKLLKVDASYKLYGIREKSPSFDSFQISNILSTTCSWRFMNNRLTLVHRYDFHHNDSLAGFGQDFTTHYLTGSIGYWVKKGKAHISLSGHDLLNSDSPLRYNKTALYEEFSTSPLLGRYFMLNFRYVFKQTK